MRVASLTHSVIRSSRVPRYEVSVKYWSKLVTSQVYLEKPNDIVAVLEAPALPWGGGRGVLRAGGPEGR